MSDNERLEALRRRVEQDPASIAFAHLAEEYRRSGLYEQAVETCRAGLAYHPTYLSARVTLGRALAGLGRFDEAQAELEAVLQSAPENLAAIRGLAEVQQKRGDAPTSGKVRYPGAALAAAKDHQELQSLVRKLARRLDSEAGSPMPEPPRHITPGVADPARDEFFGAGSDLVMSGGSRPDPPAPQTWRPPDRLRDEFFGAPRVPSAAEGASAQASAPPASTHSALPRGGRPAFETQASSQGGASAGNAHASSPDGVMSLESASSREAAASPRGGEFPGAGASSDEAKALSHDRAPNFDPPPKPARVTLELRPEEAGAPTGFDAVVTELATQQASRHPTLILHAPAPPEEPADLLSDVWLRDPTAAPEPPLVLPAPEDPEKVLAAKLLPVLEQWLAQIEAARG